MMPTRKTLLLSQSIYYLAISAWPLLHVDSFMWVTGYKTDLTLVQLVAAITLAISLLFLSDTHRKEPARGTVLLAIIVAIEFGTMDLLYGITGVISRVYLIDAVVQMSFLVLWGSWFRSRNMAH
jgi:hypothetical protein